MHSDHGKSHKNYVSLMRCRKIPDPNISLLWIVEQRERIKDRDGSGDHKLTKLFFVWKMVPKTRQPRKGAEDINHLSRFKFMSIYEDFKILSDYLH